MSNVALNLKELRKSRGLSQEKLAKKSSVSQQAISKIEAGKSSPTEVVLSMLASALCVPVTALLEDNEKTAAREGGGIKEEISTLLLDLSEDELQHMREYAEFLKSRRGKI